MTLKALFEKLINYDLESFTLQTLFPVVKGIIYGAMALVVFVALIVGVFLLLDLIGKLKLKAKPKHQISSNPGIEGLSIDPTQWHKSDSREGLYCLYCAKKLGATAWKNYESYYCDDCHRKLNELK